MDNENETFLINSVCLNFIPDIKIAAIDWAYYFTLIGASFGILVSRIASHVSFLVIAVTILLSVFIAFIVKNSLFPQTPISARGHDSLELRVLQDLDDLSSQEEQTIFNLEEEQEIPKRTSSKHNVVTYEKKEL
jgi:hypothetical protein